MLLFAGTHSTAGPAAAECPFIPPFPRAEPAIRSADEVIVGELVSASAADLDLGPNQGPRKMAMRVTKVLRGPKTVGDLVDVEYLQPNWPWIKYRGGNGQAVPSCTYLSMEANVGDTIALALGAVQPRQRLEVDGVSWMQPRTTFNAMSKIRSPALLAEIRRIAGLPETDMAPDVVAVSAARPDLSWPVAFATGVVGGAVAWWRAVCHGGISSRRGRGAERRADEDGLLWYGRRVDAERDEAATRHIVTDERYEVVRVHRNRALRPAAALSRLE
jgi:hypothetical protein